MFTKMHAAEMLRCVVTAGLGIAAGAVATSAAQRRTFDALDARLKCLERTTQAQRHTNLTYQQRLHWELLSKAMDDADLAEVLDAYGEGVSTKRQRQYLYANAMYTNMVLNYRIGNFTRDQFYGYARGMLQNPIVREYWHATQPHRATLDSTTEEAQLGLMVDDLLHQLEEADIDEWWVVGEPPPA